MEGETEKPYFIEPFPPFLGTTNSLQQLTAGNKSNLVLKAMLRYFQKIPPLKKILQF